MPMFFRQFDEPRLFTAVSLLSIIGEFSLKKWISETSMEEGWVAFGRRIQWSLEGTWSASSVSRLPAYKLEEIWFLLALILVACRETLYAWMSMARTAIVALAFGLKLLTRFSGFSFTAFIHDGFLCEYYLVAFTCHWVSSCRCVILNACSTFWYHAWCFLVLGRFFRSEGVKISLCSGTFGFLILTMCQLSYRHNINLCNVGVVVFLGLEQSISNQKLLL